MNDEMIYNKMLFKLLGEHLVEIVKDENLKASANLLVERLKNDLDEELFNSKNISNLNEIETDIKSQMKNKLIYGLYILFTRIDAYLKTEKDISVEVFKGNENLREELTFIHKIKPLEKFIKTMMIDEILKKLTNFEQQENFKDLPIIKKINLLRETLKNYNIENNLFHNAFDKFDEIDVEVSQINKQGKQIEKKESKEIEESEELKLLHNKIENLKAMKEKLSDKSFSMTKLNEIEKNFKIFESDLLDGYGNLIKKIKIQLFTIPDDSKDKEKIFNENKKLSTEKREVEKMLIEMKILISEKKDELSKIL